MQEKAYLLEGRHIACNRGCMPSFEGIFALSFLLLKKPGLVVFTEKREKFDGECILVSSHPSCINI